MKWQYIATFPWWLWCLHHVVCWCIPLTLKVHNGTSDGRFLTSFKIFYYVGGVHCVRSWGGTKGPMKWSTNYMPWIYSAYISSTYVNIYVSIYTEYSQHIHLMYTSVYMDILNMFNMYVEYVQQMFRVRVHIYVIYWVCLVYTPNVCVSFCVYILNTFNVYIHHIHQYIYWTYMLAGRSVGYWSFIDMFPNIVVVLPMYYRIFSLNFNWNILIFRKPKFMTTDSSKLKAYFI